MLPSFQLLIVFYLISVALSTPLSHDESRSQSLSLGTANASAPTTASLPDFNASRPLDETMFYPHRFRVPTTQTVMYIGFGIIRRSINIEDLQSLLLSAKGRILDGFEDHGRTSVYPVQAGIGRQVFYQLGFGIQITINNLEEDDLFFTWQQLYEVVEGLRLYLVQGGRSYVTYFQFWNGPGKFPEFDWEGSRPPLGRGSVSRVRSTGAAEEG